MKISIHIKYNFVLHTYYQPKTFWLLEEKYIFLIKFWSSPIYLFLSGFHTQKVLVLFLSKLIHTKFIHTTIPTNKIIEALKMFFNYLINAVLQTSLACFENIILLKVNESRLSGVHVFFMSNTLQAGRLELSNTLRLNFCYFKIFCFLHLSYHPKT